LLDSTKGTPLGQHWLRGLWKPKWFSDISPNFFTVADASGFRMGLV
jgi:hypothetical protein